VFNIYIYIFLQEFGVERKGTYKLQALLKIEEEVQEMWHEKKVFEEDAPVAGSPEWKLVSHVCWWCNKNTGLKASGSMLQCSEEY